MFKKIKSCILLIIIITLFFCGCKKNPTSAKEEKTKETQYDNLFEISEFLDENAYNQYMDDDGTRFQNVLNLKEKMKKSNEFDFYSFSNNFLEIIEEIIPDSCRVNYGTEYESDSIYFLDNEKVTAAEAIQVSPNFFSLFPLEINGSENFEIVDFCYEENERIPVLLGNAYQNTFSLGDVFEGYYICERKEFEVVGFIGSGSQFYFKSQNRMINYDNFIVMPFENIKTDSETSRAILLQEICGYVRPKENIEKTRKTIIEYLNDANLGEWKDSYCISEKSVGRKIYP